MVKKPKDVIEIPADVWAGATSLEDLENWLIAHEPESIAALTEARDQHVRGELVSLEEIRARLAARGAEA